LKTKIKKSDKNLQVLHKLISNGFYEGYVRAEKFELSRKNFPNNYKFIGILNDEGSYELKFGLKFPMSIAATVLLAIGTLFLVISLWRGSYLFLVIFLIIGLIIFLDFKLKEKKETNYFTDRFIKIREIESA
jgi:hypothetical protein